MSARRFSRRCRLSGDPLDIAVDGTPRVRDSIVHAVETITSIQCRFADDSNFFVYAGWRSMIDATAQRHDARSRLRDIDDRIEIKSYDSFLDLFVER